MSRAFVGFLAASLWALSACTGLQGGEPHEDDATSVVLSDDWRYEVPDECRLSFTGAT